MAEDASLGVCAAVKIALAGGAAGFTVGEAALLAVAPALIRSGPLGGATALAAVAEKVGSTGLAGAVACLVFAGTFFSLGFGFNLASLLMASLARLGRGASSSTSHGAWLVDSAAGAFTAAGAVAAGALGGLVPAWCALGAQCVLVIAAYLGSNVNETATALLVIYAALHASAVLGRMGLLLGLLATGATAASIVGLRNFLRKRWTSPARQAAPAATGLLGRLSLSIVVVTSLGFPIGLGLGPDLGGEAEVASLLEAVFWVGVLFAPLLGASLGTMGAAGLGPRGAERMAVAAAAVSCVALNAGLPVCAAALGARSCLGLVLGAATAAGLSLAAARVALRAEHGATNATLGAVVAGVLLGLGYASWTTAAAAAPWYRLLSSTVTVSAVAALAFFCGAPRSPFNLQWGPGTGAELMRQLGKETVATGAAPLGAGALGAAALGTAALGSLGTAGVAAAVLLALGKTLKSMAEKPVKAEDPDKHAD